MARYTTAYSSFVTRPDEVEALRRFAAAKEREDAVALRADISALCRGSVVLLSSHLEAYIKELGELALDSLHAQSVSRASLTSRFFYHISKNALDEIKDTSDPDKISDKVFDFIIEDGEYWSRTGSFPGPVPSERFNKGFSNPAFKKIKAYLNRFGYSDYRRDLAGKLQANFQPTINMVDHLVDTRNKIAHGDPSATKTPSEVKDMVVIVKRYCSETDSVFATWWKNSFCSIR
jgi:hypothetical protein